MPERKSWHKPIPQDDETARPKKSHCLVRFASWLVEHFQAHMLERGPPCLAAAGMEPQHICILSLMNFVQGDLFLPILSLFEAARCTMCVSMHVNTAWFGRTGDMVRAPDQATAASHEDLQCGLAWFAKWCSTAMVL